MPTKEELDEVLQWCEHKKKERNSIYILEKNPFSSKFEWARNIINIEIDKPLSAAMKTSLVYDSTTKRIYRYMNYTWMPLSAGK